MTAAFRDRPSRNRASGVSRPGPLAVGPVHTTTGALPIPANDGSSVTDFSGRSFADESLDTTRSRRTPWRLLSFIAVVGVPVALAVLYYFLIAADQYVTEFRFALRTVDPARGEVSGMLQGSVAPSPVGVDSYAVVQYIGSRDIIDDIGKALDLREMFSRSDADWLSRLQLPVSIEELVRYWKNQVDPFYDVTNGTIVVRVRAFTADDALKLAQAFFASSEHLVNDMSARAA